MKISENKFVVLFILVMVVIPVIVVGIFVLPMIPEIRYGNRPELSEKVEVVDKRISRDSSISKGVSSFSYDYIVAFKFPDGSGKELLVGRVGRVSEKESKQGYTCPSYDAISEGDVGVLTYKEIANIEKKYKNEDIRYVGRSFISFEKDSEYGGAKIELSEDSNRWPLFVFTGICLSPFIVIGVIKLKKILKKKLSS